MSEEQQIVVIGPDGQPVARQAPAAEHEDDDRDEGEGPLTELVEQPAKVMRIGSMIRQLLEEVKSAPLDEASRQRLAEIHRSSIKELEQGLAPELVEELERLSLPFSEQTVPSESELRIAQAQLVGWLEGLFHGIQTAIYAQQMTARAQAQLVGWLEGLFHGIQTAIYAQQMTARAQFEQMRRALPPGMSPETGAPGQQPTEQAAGHDPTNGMYL